MKRKILLIALLGMMSSAYAQDTTYDARSLGMGGTGIAVANTMNAAWMNPALLPANGDSKFALTFPLLSVRVQDPGEMRTNMNTIQTSSNNLNVALSNFSTAYNAANVPAPTPAQVTAAQNAAAAAGVALNNFSAALSKNSDQPVSGNVFAGTALAIPSEKISVALILDKRAEIGAKYVYSQQDQATIATLGTNLQACSAATAANFTTCTQASAVVGAAGLITGLNSTLLVSGVDAMDVGIALAHRFSAIDLDVGVTPKFTKLAITDVMVDLQQNPNLTNNGVTESNSVFNMDVGVAKSFGNRDQTIRVGGTIKDMMSKDMTSATGHTIQIKPRATAGVGYITKFVKAGVDLDVLANKPMLVDTGFESQFLRLGVELDAWGWA